jgi:hypothetical protein
LRGQLRLQNFVIGVIRAFQNSSIFTIGAAEYGQLNFLFIKKQVMILKRCDGRYYSVGCGTSQTPDKEIFTDAEH